MGAAPAPYDNLCFHHGKRAMSESDSCCVDGLSRVQQGTHLGLVDVVDIPAEDALGDGLVPTARLAKRNDAWARECRAGVPCCEAVLGEILLVRAEADDIVATCPAECERLRPDTCAEMLDVVAIAAEPSH